MIKLVAFDWNGTILSDTIPCFEGANQELLAAGCKPVSLLRWRQTFSIPYIECLVANGADRDFVIKNSEKLSAAFHDYYEPRASKCRTRSGVRQVLSWLHRSQVTAVIFSNHTSAGIESQLRRLNIQTHFDRVIANSKIDNALHNKDKGQKLFSHVRAKKFKPHEVLVVGDTEEEIEIGKHYGFITVGITGGYVTTARLAKTHPDFLIHNLIELEKIVKKLNAKR